MTQTTILRAGALLASMAAAALVFVLARIASAALGAETAPWVPALAVIGAGAGAVAAGLRSSSLAPSRLLAATGPLLGAASLAAIVAIIATLKLAPPADGGLAAPARLAAVAALVALPFAPVGAALAAAQAHARARGPAVAAAALAGAALGVPLAAALLRGVGAPRAALVLAVLLAATGVAVALGALLAPRGVDRGQPAVAWGFFLGAAAVLGGELGAPFLRLSHTRGARPDRAELVAWSELGLVTADIPSRAGTAWIHADGGGASAVIAAGAEPPKHPDQMVYVLPGPRAPVLVAGAGGGREVRAALAAGQREIFAAEVDPVVVREMARGRLREHAGEVYERSEVRVVPTDPRGYAERNAGAFRTIVATLDGGSAAGPAATFTTAESGLATVEGVGALLAALAPGGVLVLSRPDEDAERLVVLVAAALRARGVARPRDHLFGCSHQGRTSILAAGGELDRGAVAALRAWCRRARFKEVVAPDRARSASLASLVDHPAAAAAVADRDLTPPTDDRPFFEHQLRPDGLASALLDRAAWARHPLLAASAGLSALGVAALAALLAVARAGGGRAPQGAPRGLAFAALVGAGQGLLVVGLVQRLGLFVAHPSHALLVVLATAMAGAAVGAASARAVAGRDVARSAARRAGATAIVAAVLAAGLGPLLGPAADLPTAGRALVSAALGLTVGALAGGLLPLGARALASWSPRRAALAIGVAGGGAAAGLGLGALLALHAGLSYVLLLAAAAHLAAGLVVVAPTATRPARPRT